MQTPSDTSVVRATLAVRVIYGVKGEFRIGTLTSPIGTFVLKNQILEQLNEGIYEGVFEIDNIHLVDYDVPGKKIIEQRASLIDMAIDGEEAGIVAADEPDPDDEPATADKPAPSKKPQIVKPPITEPAVSSIAELTPGQREVLGNEVVAQIEADGEVKLDPSVGRPLLRTQTQIMRQFGYSFNARERVWRK